MAEFWKRSDLTVFGCFLQTEHYLPTANLPVKLLLIDTHIGYYTTKLKLPYFDLLAIFKLIWDCLVVWKSDFWILTLMSNIITHHNQLVHNWKSWVSFFQHTLGVHVLLQRSLIKSLTRSFNIHKITSLLRSESEHMPLLRSMSPLFWKI